MRTAEVIAVICVRYMLLPAVGIFVVRAATQFGFLPSDPLFHFVLLIQFTLPPAMNIGTHFFILKHITFISSVKGSTIFNANISSISSYKFVLTTMNNNGRYDDATIQCGTRRVFCPVPMDLPCCSTCYHWMVNCFHVDLVLN